MIYFWYPFYAYIFIVDTSKDSADAEKTIFESEKYVKANFSSQKNVKHMFEQKVRTN